MLTIVQKADILQKSGIETPAPPTGPDPVEAKAWTTAIDNLFVSHAAARAAKSLRDSEEVRQLGVLRQIASRSDAYARL